MTAYPLAQDTAHVTEALALLTGQFSSDTRTPNVRNLARVGALRTQDIENVLWNVINSQLLAQSPTGQALNQLGDLIGEPRGALNDTQYLLWIQVAIRARSSGGRAEDLLAICELALGLNSVTYTDIPNARFDIYAPALVTNQYAEPLAEALTLARPLGVYGVLDWYDTPTFVLPLLSFADSVSHTGGAGFADAISGVGQAVPISAISLAPQGANLGP